MENVVILAIIAFVLVSFCLIQVVVSNNNFKKQKKIHAPVKHAPIPWYDKDGRLILIDDDYIKNNP